MSRRGKHVADSGTLPGIGHPADTSPLPGRDVRRILLALIANECSWATLWRAQSLSALLEAELHVVRVVSPLPRTQRPLSKVESKDVLAALTQMLEARRATRTWLTGALGAALPKGRLKLRGGEFVEQVAKRARELNAALIVVAPGAERAGKRVTHLARSADIPVLVAREATAREAVVAATDLSESSAAVLQSAAALCQRLDAPLVAVHNLTPVPLPAGPEAALQISLPLHRGIEQQRRRSLVEAARTLQVNAEAVLTRELDPAQAILKEARTRDADLIVVGTRPRRWLERLVRGGVSEQVVSQARRSVLVTPLACETDAGAPRYRLRHLLFHRMTRRRPHFTRRKRAPRHTGSALGRRYA